MVLLLSAPRGCDSTYLLFVIKAQLKEEQLSGPREAVASRLPRHLQENLGVPEHKRKEPLAAVISDGFSTRPSQLSVFLRVSTRLSQDDVDHVCYSDALELTLLRAEGGDKPALLNNRRAENYPRVMHKASPKP